MDVCRVSESREVTRVTRCILVSKGSEHTACPIHMITYVYTGSYTVCLVQVEMLCSWECGVHPLLYSSTYFMLVFTVYRERPP